MKKGLILFTFLLILTAVESVFAQYSGSFTNPTYSPEFIADRQSMRANRDQLFPRLLFNEMFNDKTKPSVNRLDEGYYFSEMERAGQIEMLLSSVNAFTENHGRGQTHFNMTGSYENFYASIEARFLEMDDSNNGYLWFQYTNGNIVGESRRDSVTISFPYRVTKYSTLSGERVETTLYELNDFVSDYEVHTLELFRLNGEASIFIDGQFITSFMDGFSGRFYPIYGVGLETGGTYVAGSFDNLVIRVQ